MCVCKKHVFNLSSCTIMYILCLPVVFVYFMLSLYVQLRNGFFNCAHSNSISVITWHIYFHFLLILLVTFDESSQQVSG
jgi:hypothetical protein